MKLRLAAVSFAALMMGATAGCGGTTGGDAGNNTPDLSGNSSLPDLSGSSTSNDLSGTVATPVDMATTDLGGKFSLSWRMFKLPKAPSTANCDDYGVTSLAFDLTAGTTTVTTTIPCPAGLYYGDADVDVPAGATTFDVLGRAIGQNTGHSQLYMGVGNMDNLTVTIYALDQD